MDNLKTNLNGGFILGIAISLICAIATVDLIGQLILSLWGAK